MSIDADGVPPERFKPMAVSLNIESVHRSLALPERVDIDNPDEVVEVVMRCQRRRFPDAPLRNLAIAEEDIDAVVRFVKVFAIECHAEPEGQSLSE